MKKQGVEILPQLIRKHRIEANLTAAQVAEKLGIQEANYRKYENGSRIPKAPVVSHLAKIFSCTVDSLYDDRTKFFIDKGKTSIIAFSLEDRICFDSEAFYLFDYWSYWGADKVGRGVQSFFSGELQTMGASSTSTIKEIFLSSDRFFSPELAEDDASRHLRIQAGVLFMANMIEYLNDVDRAERPDLDVLEEVRSALNLPTIERARQEFLTRLYIPFIYFLENALLWSEGFSSDMECEAVLTSEGYRAAVCNFFYGHPNR